MVCLHGFTDTWRTWELVLDTLERDHDVLAPALPGHAGGPPLEGPIGDYDLAAGIERAMDEAGFETAHIVGNSLGGYVALQLASRGRARTVVALAPAGGWAPEGETHLERLEYSETAQELLKGAAPFADQIVSTAEGRRRATEYLAVNYEHIPPELIAHQIRGAAACPAVWALIERARGTAGRSRLRRSSAPCGSCGGPRTGCFAGRRPRAATAETLPHADWIELAGVGHSPQLDVPAETAELILGFTRPALASRDS